MIWEKQLAHFISENFSGMDRELFEKLAFFGSEVLKWNASISLISRKNPELTLVRLLADSLFLLNVIKGNEAFLDIGAGAGFPSIPVLLRSHTRGTLVEARKRRAAFLNHILHALDITNARVIEQAITPETVLEASNFDCLWSKAGIPLNELFACAEKWLYPRGRLIIFRPFQTSDEKNRVMTLARHHHLSYAVYKVFKAPSLSLTRTLTIYEKNPSEMPQKA